MYAVHAVCTVLCQSRCHVCSQGDQHPQDRLALMFLCGLNFRHRDAKALAIVDVQAHLTTYVVDDCGTLGESISNPSRITGNTYS